MAPCRVLVIIPAFNEARTIESVVAGICQAAAGMRTVTIDTVVIDDYSVDGTAAACARAGIAAVHLPCNLGIGGAVQTGYKYALQHEYDIAVQMDGDGQHNAEYLADLIEPVVTGKADMVIGSRFIGRKGFKSTITRRIGIRFLSILISFVTGSKFTDPTSGFRACNASVIKLFADYYPKDYPEPESLVYLRRKRKTILEREVVMNERSEGTSSINFVRSIYYIIKVSAAIVIDSLREREEQC